MRPPSADRSAWVPPRPPPLNIRGTDAWSANVKRGGAADFTFLISSFNPYKSLHPPWGGASVTSYSPARKLKGPARYLHQQANSMVEGRFGPGKLCGDRGNSPKSAPAAPRHRLRGSGRATCNHAHTCNTHLLSF